MHTLVSVVTRVLAPRKSGLDVGSAFARGVSPLCGSGNPAQHGQQGQQPGQGGDDVGAPDQRLVRPRRCPR
jgi:hypothetical protein